MKSKTYYDQTNDCVIGRVTGDIADSGAFQTYAKDMFGVMSQHNCGRLLHDLREAELGLSVVDLYYLPENLAMIASELVLDYRSWKRAIIVSGDSERYSFFETVACNRGHLVKIFLDPDEALNWLT